MTRIFKFHGQSINDRFIKTAIENLNNGNVVLVPTDTGYAFVAHPRLESGVAKFFELRSTHSKQKPFSLLCADTASVGRIATLTTPTYRLAQRAWPGPYTFILEPNKLAPKLASGPKRKSIGIRVPNHFITKALLQEMNEPLLVTSVTDAEELQKEMYYEDQNEVDHWWTSAASIVGHFRNQNFICLEAESFIPLRTSTIIDFTEEPAVIIRDGEWDTDIIGSLS